MANGRVFTRQDQRAIKELHSQGLCQSEIGRAIDRTPSAIGYQMEKLGIKINKNAVNKKGGTARSKQENANELPVIRCKCPTCKKVTFEATDQYTGREPWYKYCDPNQPGSCSGRHKAEHYNTQLTVSAAIQF